MPNDRINEELEKAVSANDLEKVKALLAAGADPNYRSKEKRDEDTFLHSSHNVEIINELLKHGAYVDRTNVYRETPLHYAVKSNDFEKVRVLLKYKANVNALNRKHITALNFAAKKWSPRLSIVLELLKHGGDINIQNREISIYQHCNSPFDNAMNNLDCGKLLINFTLLKKFSNNYKTVINLEPYSEWKYYDCFSKYLNDCL